MKNEREKKYRKLLPPFVATLLLSGLLYLAHDTATASPDVHQPPSPAAPTIVGGRELSLEQYDNVIQATAASLLYYYATLPDGSPQYFPSAGMTPLALRIEGNNISVLFGTAAHVTEAMLQDPLLSDLCWGYANTYNCVNALPAGQGPITMADEVSHPDFVPQTLQNDLGAALLTTTMDRLPLSLRRKLAEVLAIQGKTIPTDTTVVTADWVLLPGETVSLTLPASLTSTVEVFSAIEITPGAQMEAAGWGRLQEALHSQMGPINQITITVGTTAEGYVSDPTFDPQTMVAMGDLEGKKDACVGDSGTGNYISDDGGNVGLLPKLSGIVSHGIGCARKGLLGIYARVDTGWFGKMKEYFKQTGKLQKRMVFLPITWMSR